MTEQEWMQEGMDFRLHFLLFCRKWWVIVLLGLMGALLFGGVYLLRHVVYAPAREYEAVSRYYITFAEDRGRDYYNDYTWNDLAASDPILDYTMALLEQRYDRTEVQESVEAKIPSDVRVLMTTVTTTDPNKTLEIALATEQSICHFGEIMPEISKIEVILDAQVQPVIVNLHTVKATLLGLITGAVCGLFLVLFWRVLDTSVYVETEVERRFGILLLGRLYQGEASFDASKDAAWEAARNRQELSANLAYRAAGKQILMPLTEAEQKTAKQIAAEVKAAGTQLLAEKSCLSHPEIYSSLREADGVILLLKSGANHGRLLTKEIAQLRKQECRISGILLYDVDQKLEALYYAQLPLLWRLYGKGCR